MNETTIYILDDLSIKKMGSSKKYANIFVTLYSRQVLYVLYTSSIVFRSMPTLRNLI